MPTKINDRLLSWASDIDEGTIRQAEKTSRLSIVAGHVALMPDAHVGMGATVGSVIPTENAIIPSAVGVDIGCVDADTEYLSPCGWRRIADYNGGSVMQYHADTGLADLVAPLRYIKREQAGFLHLRTKYGVDQMLTPDHRILCWEIVGRDRRRVRTVLTAGEFADRHARLKQGFKAEFETAFTPLIETSLPLDDAQLRVQAMFMADGCIVSKSTGVCAFKKARKIERSRKLLDDAEIDYTETTGDDRTTFRFAPPMLVKSYKSFWSASAAQLEVLVDEVLHWDGHEADRVFFTRDQESANFIHYAFAATGHRSVVRSDIDKSDGTADYRVYAHLDSRTSMAGVPKTAIVKVPSTDGFAYCFTVPSGFLVLRRDGNIFMTGNCGMVAAELSASASDLPDDLEPLMPLIAKAVPAGVGKGHEHSTRTADQWMATHRPHSELTSKQESTALAQFGSLGSGNHFLELCLDERDRVWVVLHSGSRGIGNQLANVHIDKAKQMAKDLHLRLEDPDLAYFMDDQPEFQAYIADMLWAQAYAMANREQMMDAALAQVLRFIGGEVRETDRVNAHHNFTHLEYFPVVLSDGTTSSDPWPFWITRKGAIKADKGDRGIIPGSMGTRSYIVRGKGNAMSWNSCSHGAGRRMSRSAAKRQFTAEDLAGMMEGKVWNSDHAGSLIDEIPSSYKDIDQVMADQADLVEIEHTLHQVLNYKGT